MGLLDDIGLGMGDVLSAATSYITNERTNRANRGMAREQRAWEKDMSDTAHQREVEDLQKAGLNPALSATGGAGASTPTGATATQTEPDFLSAILAKAEFDKTKAETDQTKEITRGIKNENDKNKPLYDYEKYWNEFKKNHPIMSGIYEGSKDLLSAAGGISGIVAPFKTMSTRQVMSQIQKLKRTMGTKAKQK